MKHTSNITNSFCGYFEKNVPDLCAKFDPVPKLLIIMYEVVIQIWKSFQSWVIAHKLLMTSLLLEAIFIEFSKGTVPAFFWILCFNKNELLSQESEQFQLQRPYKKRRSTSFGINQKKITNNIFPQTWNGLVAIIFTQSSYRAVVSVSKIYRWVWIWIYTTIFYISIRTFLNGCDRKPKATARVIENGHPGWVSYVRKDVTT